MISIGRTWYAAILFSPWTARDRTIFITWPRWSTIVFSSRPYVETRGTVRSPSDGADKSWKNSTIADRSSCDQATIAHHSSRNQSTIVRRHFLENLEHDRRPIVVDRRKNRGYDKAEIVAKLRPIHGQSRSYDIAPRNRSHDPARPPPRPLQWPTKSG